mmetsp:Transcript_52071/g.163521  ORF Transcript_52071/g.163521 Transcript_52071/m.163521 type:complete len:488 (+) Transcript_52071:93-1556(+)
MASRSPAVAIIAVAALGHAAEGLVARSASHVELRPSYLSQTGTAALDLQRFPENRYLWPSPRGRGGLYSESLFSGPSDLNRSLAWSWHHPEGRFHTVLFGQVMDDKKNIYLTCAEGIRKFSPDGELLWEYARGQPRYALTAEITTSGSLWKGMFFSQTSGCEMFALDMETGDAVWVRTIADKCAGDSGFTMVHDGIVLAASDVPPESPDCAKTRVQARNATNGAHLWDIRPDHPIWSFLPYFTGDGTFVFQDMQGRAYRHRTRDGSLLWKAGGDESSWTDGQALLGSNGIVYAVTRFAPFGVYHGDDPGRLTAYRLEDGQQLWNQSVPRAPNQSPALGRLPGKSGLSIVQPVGSQCVQHAHTDVYAFDAATGEPQWVFRGPAQQGRLQRAEAEGMAERFAAHVRPITLPHPWSETTIDASGVVYIGSEEGGFYALADQDGDGEVKGESEVSMMDTEACFHGDSSVIIAPGLTVTSSTDTLFAFKTPE